MNTFERAPRHDEKPDMAMGIDLDSFNINAAFQEAVHGVASDTELVIEEKIRRMELIISEGASEMYRDFVDFRQMAAQMEMMCSHDHALNQSMQNSETLAGFMDNYKADYDHSHGHSDTSTRGKRDAKTGKKTRKKKQRNWFGISF